MYDASRPIDEFVEATASRQPTPGGGSVTALVGALGAALGEMVVNYSLGKKGLEAYAGELQPALGELKGARQALLKLMAEDQLAYESLSALRKLPADSAERRSKMPAAVEACIRVPQEVAATSARVLEHCDKIVNFVNPYLLSDLRICADLAMASIRCANYNVHANLSSIEDATARGDVARAADKLLESALKLIQSAGPRIRDRAEQGG
jgi:formiminotetrahydrofolate cyclodeaminase